MFRNNMGKSLCLGLVIACSALVLSIPATAADLTVTGGRGGDVVDPAGYENGGQGGHVSDDAFWASGGGGGGGGNAINLQQGQTGGNGTSASGGPGGAGGSGIGSGIGGEGGIGDNSYGQTSAGSPHSGESGGDGGGYVNQNYANGSFTAEGGKGGAPIIGGGNGGAAGLNLTGESVDYGTITVSSGADGSLVNYLGSKVPGQGGAASFTANRAKVANIILTKNGGALNFNLGSLEVATSNTTITLDGTTAAGVNIGNNGGLIFANGNSLTVNQINGGTMTGAGNISVTGSGAYNSPIAWNAAGKALSFNLNGVTAANNTNDVSLKATGSAGVTLDNATSLSVTNASGLVPLYLGGKYTLIDRTTGAFSTQNLADITSGAESHGLIANADSSLYIFKNRIQTAGDYNFAGNYTITAGSGPNESVTLDVGGLLTAGVGGLTLTSNGANSATVNAGTLVTPQLSLVGTNAKAAIATLDTSSGNTVLNLDGTTAAGVNIGNNGGLIFANGNSLTVNQINGGTMTGAGNISVTGSGAYNSPIAWNAAGKALSFNLNGVTAANNTNDVSLKATGSAGVTLDNATTLSVTNASGLVPLYLGGKYTLIDRTTGALATQSLADITSGAETHGLIANAGSSLYIFKNRIQTAGDYNFAGNYAITAGSGPNESVALSVGGLLTAGGGGLTLTSNGANSATVNAGTLVTPQLSLTGANAKAAITTLDVSNGNTVLNLDGTTAAGVSIHTVHLSHGKTLTMLGTGTGTFTNLDVGLGANTFAGSNSPLFTNVNLAGDSSLTATNQLNFTNMRVLGRNASYTGTLNAAGKNLIFNLPLGLKPGQPMLNVDGVAELASAAVTLNQTPRPLVEPGESLTLIDSTTAPNGYTAQTVQASSGDLYLVQISGKQLLATLQGISPTSPVYPRLKPYAEARAASLAFVNQGADLILNQGMGSALLATRGPGLQLGSFAAGSGGWNRYDTGSHVDVSGATMLIGLGAGNDAGPGRVTAGAFFEGGWGNYNSYNSFSNYASVDGNGDTSYYGGGLLGRYEVTEGAFSGLYTDASFRLGQTNADFSTDDIRYNGSKANFDSGSMYWGAHAGLGYQWSFSEKAMLDISGKFIWTRQDGDNVDVYGDQVQFNEADSLRTRLGGRFNYAVNDYITPYAGAYWEHEFDGNQHNSVNAVDILTPTLKGDTGVGELGINIKPMKNSGFSMDLNVQGYTGVRQGVTGSLQLKFEF